MKPNKSFDCVAMKDAIQRQLLNECAGLTLAERQGLMERKILGNPILGPWWQKVKAKAALPAIAAETPAAYGVKPTKQQERT